MQKYLHGEYINDPDHAYRDARWCEKHGFFHRALYICKHYPADLREALTYRIEFFMRYTVDSKWLAEQIKEDNIRQETYLMYYICAGLI